jgi:hypothetical protein
MLPTRRSARNAGKVANYNIDDLLDAADEAGLSMMDREEVKSGKGSGCI